MNKNTSKRMKINVKTWIVKQNKKFSLSLSLYIYTEMSTGNIKTNNVSEE
jgi:hypothetical protein